MYFFPAIYKGQVYESIDPEQRNRIKVICPIVTGSVTDPLANWAYPNPFFGGSNGNYGGIFPPEDGDFVFVQFIDGDIESPVWSPGPWPNNTEANAVPRHARGAPDNEDIREYENIPKSNYRGEYGQVRMIKTPSGHSLELDDTKGNERVSLYHKVGSFIEFISDGSKHESTLGKSIQFISGGTNIKRNDSYKEVILGNRELEISKGEKKVVNGATTDDNGNMVSGDYFYLGEVKYSVGKLSFSSAADEKRDVSGSMIYTCAANKKESIGGSKTTLINKNEYKQVMENSFNVVQNSSDKEGTGQAYLLRVLNGVMTHICTTDPINKAGYIDIDPTNNITRIYNGLLSSVDDIVNQSTSSQGSGIIIEQSKLTLHALTELLIKTKTIKLEGETEIIIKAPTINIDGNSEVNIGSPDINIESTGNAKFTATTNAEVGGTAKTDIKGAEINLGLGTNAILLDTFIDILGPILTASVDTYGKPTMPSAMAGLQATKLLYMTSTVKTQL